MVESELNRNQLILLKGGDIQAFDAIYNRYCRRLFAFVIRYLKCEEDAEEIVQEVFIRVWENRERINIFSSFESFLFTIAYNATISLIRKRVNEKKYLDYIISMQEQPNSPEVVDEVQFYELTEKVNSLLKELTPRQQEIFRLSREEGLTHEEIADKLNLSSNTVKNHLVTALKYLRTNLDNGLLISALFVCLFF